MILHVVVAFALSFTVGFERQLRGGPAGDRTFSLVGTAAAAITAIAVAQGAGNAIAGVVTGVGFIGGALLFRDPGGTLRGITSATAVLATASIGVVAGAGYPLLAVVATALVVVTLEVRYLPGLRYLDASRYMGSVRGDDDPPPPGRRHAVPPPDPT
jgi:putative Mg2+ transporter-C (MgtC) family protein